MPAARASGPREPVAGDQCPVHRLGGEGGRQQGGHALAHREPEVDLGHAPVATVLAHHDPVVGAAQQGTGAEGVPVHRRHRDPTEAEDAAPQAVQVAEHRARGGLVGPQPVEVEPVAVEAFGAGRDEGDGPSWASTSSSTSCQRATADAVEAVLPVRHRHDGDGPLPGELDHARSLARRGTTAPVSPPARCCGGQRSSLGSVADYRPPLRDIHFVLDHLDRPRRASASYRPFAAPRPGHDQGRARGERPVHRRGDRPPQPGRATSRAAGTTRPPTRSARPRGSSTPTTGTSRPGGVACRSRRTTAAAASRGSSASPCRSSSRRRTWRSRWRRCSPRAPSTCCCTTAARSRRSSTSRRW